MLSFCEQNESESPVGAYASFSLSEKCSHTVWLNGKREKVRNKRKRKRINQDGKH